MTFPEDFVTLILLTSLIHALPAHAAKPAVSCTAVYRTLDDRNNTVERSAAVPVKAVLGETVKHEAELEGRVFRLTEDHGDLFAQISTPTDLAHGVTARGTPDSLGRFSASEVIGFTVYRLECSRTN